MSIVDELGDEIYHATWPTHLHRIMTEGIKMNRFGEVFLAGPDIMHAAQFLAIRPGEYRGGNLQDFELVVHDKLYVVGVRTADLDSSLIKESGDHAHWFFQPDTVSVTYGGDIPFTAIMNVWECDRLENGSHSGDVAGGGAAAATD
jgi:hypothetical protein